MFFFSIDTHGQSFRHYKEGFYYDSEGERIDGYLYYGYSYKKELKYKVNEVAKREILTPKQVKGFVIEADSFIVVKNFYNEGLHGGQHHHESDFAQVALTGRITLLKHYSTQGSGSSNPSTPVNGLVTFLLKKHGSDDIITVSKNQKKFINIMSEALGDNPQIKDDILNGRYSIRNIEKLVSEYNSIN